ncbi:UNVERIFIED_CONTAM: hypothetical protein FKN15_026498 [Acipenser sinensis]
MIEVHIHSSTDLPGLFVNDTEEPLRLIHTADAWPRATIGIKRKTFQNDLKPGLIFKNPPKTLLLCVWLSRALSAGLLGTQTSSLFCKQQRCGS